MYLPSLVRIAINKSFGFIAFFNGFATTTK